MQDRLFSVAGHVTLVSGASRGIGYELARGFAERGAHVVITGRNQDTLHKAARELRTVAAQDARVEAIVCDVTDVDQIDELVARLVRDHDRIDTLLNVAGVSKRKPAESFTPEEYDTILRTNLKGAYFLSQKVGLQMIEQGSGSQINVDSLNSYAPVLGVLPYAMSKNGLKGMTRGLASEWGRFGVRVNGLAPGFILTALTEKHWSKPIMRDWVEKNTPLGRLGQVNDLVGTAVFLASQASAFLTGQTIYVDGGVSAGIHWPVEL